MSEWFDLEIDLELQNDYALDVGFLCGGDGSGMSGGGLEETKIQFSLDPYTEVT